MTALAIREGFAEELTFSSDAAEQASGTKGHPKKSKALGAGHPPWRRLLLPVPHVFFQRWCSRLLGTRTCRSLLSRTNEPTFCVLSCTSVFSTTYRTGKDRAASFSLAAAGHSSLRRTVICRTSPHCWTFTFFQPFGVSDTASVRLSFCTCRSLPRGHIFCGGIVGSSFCNGSKDRPSR